MVGEAGLIRSRWTRADYGELILHLLQADLTIIDSDKFTSDAPGIWLRHDVELCLQSAVEMAQLENDLEVPSTYFVCMESPSDRGSEVSLSGCSTWAARYPST